MHNLLSLPSVLSCQVAINLVYPLTDLSRHALAHTTTTTPNQSDYAVACSGSVRSSEDSAVGGVPILEAVMLQDFTKQKVNEKSINENTPVTMGTVDSTGLALPNTA